MPLEMPVGRKLKQMLALSLGKENPESTLGGFLSEPVTHVTLHMNCRSTGIQACREIRN